MDGAIDISVTIRERMPIYPGDPAVRLELARSLAAGDPANITRIDIGAHTGTHVDAPRHFIAGAPGADALPLDVLAGPCLVADAGGATVLDAAAIAALEAPPGTERLLVRTTNSALWASDQFEDRFVRLDGSGADALLGLGVRLFGIDYLSAGDAAAHVTLLGAGVVIVEGLDLREADPGPYRLACLPLKILGSDGAPARAVLWRS